MRISTATYFLVVSALLQFGTALSQGFRLDDPNLIFKSKTGQIISVDSVKKIAVLGPFSMQKNILENGKTEVIIIPMSAEDVKNAENERARFKDQWIGKTFPDFELATLSEKSIKRSSLDGKVTVINFWFIGCKPCQEEMPKLNEVVKTYESESDIQFLAPSFDKKESLVKFSSRKTFAYTILCDAGPLTKGMKINSFPTHMILDKKGTIREILSGASDGIDEKLKSSIEKILQEK